MAVFVLKAKQRGTLELEGPEVRIGRGPGVDFVVNDRMVARRHCALRYAGPGDFRVADLDSFLGTFLDGQPVAGEAAIPAGKSTLVIGRSQLAFKLDEGGSTLSADLKELSFCYDRERDPLASVRHEVTFGRFPALRRAVWGSVAAGVLVLLFCFTGGSARDGLLTAGALESAHGSDPRLVASTGCGACHDPYAGATAGRCASCHEAQVGTASFPYWTAQEWDARGRACGPCHQEHGLARSQRIPTDFQDRWPGDHGKSTWQPERTSVRVVFDTFSHRAHGEQGVACAECHQRREPEPADPGLATNPRQFAPVTFERCMGCHGPGGRSKLQVRCDWHGGQEPESACTQCHRTLYAPDLRTVAREPASPAPGGIYAWTSYDHARERAHPPTGGRPCGDCHKTGVAGRPLLRPFRHFSHLPPGDPGSACGRCHEMATSGGLGTPRRAVPDQERCRDCHRGTAPRRQTEPAAATEEVPDFPHAPHVTPTALARLVTAMGLPEAPGSCLTCHPSLDTLPRTLPEVSDCTVCHGATRDPQAGELMAGHRHVGGGACGACHRAGDRVWWNGSDREPDPLRKSWPARNTFDHGGRGHDGPCAACHAAALTAETIHGLALPDESDAACVSCHEEQRFHRR